MKRLEKGTGGKTKKAKTESAAGVCKDGSRPRACQNRGKPSPCDPRIKGEGTHKTQ